MPTAIGHHHLDDPVKDHVRHDFVRLSVGDTVGTALAGVQKGRPEGRIVYFYVVDEQGRLEGVIPTRRLLLSPPETPLGEIMERHVVTLPEDATLLDACEFFTMHRLLALPVVDRQRRIVGVVDVELYTDEISDLIRQQENEDIFQLIGVRLARLRQASVPAAFRGRFPWLLCNIAGGLACAVLAAVFQDVLDQVIVLAMFIPVVLALAESVSIQSLTLALQLHQTGQFHWETALGMLAREAAVGLLLGLGCGVVVAVAALAWHGAAVVAVVIFASIALALATATAFGLAVPVALRAARRDPKVASGPIVLAMTDIVTLFYYLALSTMFLG